MKYGKSIRVYLADGIATGIKHAEIVNWTGQAISCPRKRISELKEWPESKSPGGYFLLGEDIDYLLFQDQTEMQWKNLSATSES
jgi:hypothetical protein